MLETKSNVDNVWYIYISQFILPFKEKNPAASDFPQDEKSQIKGQHKMYSKMLLTIT